MSPVLCMILLIELYTVYDVGKARLPPLPRSDGHYWVLVGIEWGLKAKRSGVVNSARHIWLEIT